MIGGNDVDDLVSIRTPQVQPKSYRTKTKKPVKRKPISKKSNHDHDEEPEVKSLQLARTKMALETRTRPLLWSNISDADVVDDQMFSTFFDHYVPPTMTISRKASYLHTIADTSPSTALLKRAKRTIGLAYLASATHNPSIHHESQVSYSRLLGLLQFSLHFQLQAPGAKPQDMQEVMASVALLTHLHDPSVSDSPTADDSWVAHIQGIHGLFAMFSANPTLLGVTGAVYQGLARHTMLNGLWVSIAKRRAWFLDLAWLKTRSLGWTSAVSVFHKLPALLERTDKALLAGETDDLEETVNSLHEIIRRSKGLYQEIRFESASLDTLTPWLQGLAEEHSVISESETFPEMYIPFLGEDEIQSQKLLTRTIMCLIAKCTILKIWHFRPITTRRIRAETRQNIEDSAQDLARQLCKAALSYTQGDLIVHAFVLRLCLILARNVFEQQHAISEMGWCDACLLANNLRVARLRKTGGPNLCKVAQIIPGIAEAGRYGSKLNTQSLVIRAEQGKLKGLLPP